MPFFYKDDNMKILKELSIILGILFVSDLFQKFTQVPVPSTVLGMLILLLLLISGIVKIKHIENISNFFMDHLTFLFVPSCVSVMAAWGLIKDKWLAISIITIVTTFISIAAMGLSVQFVKEKMGKGEIK